MRPDGTIYFGKRVPRDGGPGAVMVQEPGQRPRRLAKRLDLSNHSPDGFQWGYAGSGPAQLALALLADAIGDDRLALRLHQPFKRAYIATLDDDEWTMPVETIRRYATDPVNRQMLKTLEGIDLD